MRGRKIENRVWDNWGYFKRGVEYNEDKKMSLITCNKPLIAQPTTQKTARNCGPMV
jgi:hypothetical protein